MGDSDLLNYVSRDYREISTYRKSTSWAYRVRRDNAEPRQAAQLGLCFHNVTLIVDGIYDEHLSVEYAKSRTFST